MNGALWAAKTGLDAQQTRMTVISNNLANVNTTGFKRDRAVFESLLYQTIRSAGTQSSESTSLPSGLSLGTGVRVAATEKLFTQGNLSHTSDNLDLAIQGRGFFQIEMPDGSTGYTRDGSFAQNAEGQMVTADGYPVIPSITLPSAVTTLTIGGDGVISATTAGTSESTQVGALQLVDFANPTGLEPVGKNIYRETSGSGAATEGTPGTDGLGTLIQGSVETSNVNVVEELVSMIETQRAYEINSKAISTVDGMLQYATNNI